MSGLSIPERYEPTELEFGGGGMSDAAVYRDKHLDRRVVIKSLKEDTDPDRLLDELVALQQLRSKYVVQIYDVIRDTANSVRGIVEEYIPGYDLLSGPSLTSGHDLIRLLCPIAAGITDIHDHGLVHRDIKPNNIKFDGENCVKIFDFGLSRAEADGATTSFAFTPGFAAPELFTAGPSGKVEFTQAVDVFAFGASALFLATGKLPGDLLEVPPILPASGADLALAPQELPDTVVSLINRCLEAVPESRPTMVEIRHALGRHLLKDRHRALLVSQGTPYVLDAANRAVNLSASGRGSLRIRYDGYHFRVSDVSGDVAINNMTIGDGYEIDGSCVIILGKYGSGRVIVTFDVAHPEVML